MFKPGERCETNGGDLRELFFVGTFGFLSPQHGGPGCRWKIRETDDNVRDQNNENAKIPIFDVAFFAGKPTRTKRFRGGKRLVSVGFWGVPKRGRTAEFGYRFSKIAIFHFGESEIFGFFRGGVSFWPHSWF